MAQKKKAKKKASVTSDSKISALKAAEKEYLANMQLCKEAISNSILEQHAIGQAVKVFEARVNDILK